MRWSSLKNWRNAFFASTDEKWFLVCKICIRHLTNELTSHIFKNFLWAKFKICKFVNLKFRTFRTPEKPHDKKKHIRSVLKILLSVEVKESRKLAVMEYRIYKKPDWSDFMCFVEWIFSFFFQFFSSSNFPSFLTRFEVILL